LDGPEKKCFSHLIEDEEVARNRKARIKDFSTIDPYKMGSGCRARSNRGFYSIDQSTDGIDRFG
jgi:hypothetical protein